MGERVSTGVEGLDEMLRGGLIPGRVYLVKGSPGSGKTTLAFQFLMEGIKKGERALYITFEEPASFLREDMRKFGFEIDNPLLKIIDATPVGKNKTIFNTIPYEDFAKSFDKLISGIEEELKSRNYRRIAIDPITMIRLTVRDELEYRRAFIEFLKEISEHGATVLLTSELSQNEIEEYLASGVIEMRKIERGEKLLRGIRITKFRGSDFDETMRPYRITDRGIVVYPNEPLF